jgi:hypothetical protein
MTHPNDMTDWNKIECRRGCESHPTRLVPIHLGGPTGYLDLPSIPHHFTAEFDFLVWDTEQTPVDGGPYCPARDAVSETILSHGVWEPVETIALLDCFQRRPGNMFVDIGAQIGWFSKLAQLSHLPVTAIEADPEVCRLLASQLWGARNFIMNERIGEGTRPIELMKNEWDLHQLTVKIDVEGAEPEAVEALESHLSTTAIDFMLIEISPVFHDRYPAMVRRIMEDGFLAGVLPEKSPRPAPFEGIADLTFFDNIDATLDEMATWHQQNVLFAHEDML